jgi:hypothetical protein
MKRDIITWDKINLTGSMSCVTVTNTKLDDTS